MNKDQLIVEFEKVLKEKDPSKAIRSIASRFGKYLREETKFLIHFTVGNIHFPPFFE